MAECSPSSDGGSVVRTTNQEDQDTLVLRLRKPPATGSEKKVQWEEGVVDNEFMGKKRSKCCCIYNPPPKPGEDSDTDNSGDEGSCGGGCHEHRVSHSRKQYPQTTQ